MSDNLTRSRCSDSDLMDNGCEKTMAHVMMIVMVQMVPWSVHAMESVLFPIRTQTLDPHGSHPDEDLRHRRIPSLARTRSAKDNAHNVTLRASSLCAVGVEDLIGCQVRAWWILLLPTPVALLLLLEFEQQLVRAFILAAGAIDADA